MVKRFGWLATAALVLVVLSSGCSRVDVVEPEPPQVIATNPVADETVVPRTVTVSITFSEELDEVTISEESFFLEPPVAGTYSYRNQTISFTPGTELDYDATYTATATTSLRNRQGQNLKSDYSWSFTTHLEPPFISSISPTTGPVGTRVQIVGSSFPSDSAATTVRFGPAAAPVLYHSESLIETEVPLGARTGGLRVSGPNGSATAPIMFTVVDPGVIWAVAVSGTEETLLGVTWASNQFIVVGTGGVILSSPDGLSWSQASSPVTSRLESVYWRPPFAVAVGSGGTIVSSFLGIEWVEQGSPTNSTLLDIVITRELYLAVGSYGTIVAATDPEHWDADYLSSSAWLYSVAWFSYRYVAVGSGGTIASTETGRYWNLWSSGTDDHLLAIDANDTLAVAVGYNGTIVTSTDAMNWTVRSAAAGCDLAGVAAAEEDIVAVGEGGCILHSSDGLTWDSQPSPTTHALYDVVWSGTRFVAVGERGTILVSQ